MNKLLTSLLVTVSLAVALFADAQYNPDYMNSYFNNTPAVPDTPKAKQEPAPMPFDMAPDVPLRIRRAFSNMPGEEQHAFIEHLSKGTTFQGKTDYRDQSVAQQDLQDVWNLLDSKQRTEKLKEWDASIQRENKEALALYSDENVAEFKKQALEKVEEYNQKSKDNKKIYGNTIDEKYYTEIGQEERFVPSDDYVPFAYQRKTIDELASEEVAKPSTPVEEEPMPLKDGVKKPWYKRIFENTPAGQQVTENIKESFKQSSLAKEQEKKDAPVLLSVKNMVERKAPLDHLQLEVADPFANNVPSFAKQQAMPRNRRSITNASFSTLFDGLSDGNTQIASIPIADEKPPVIIAKPATLVDPGASADNKEELKEKTKQSVIKSYAPWAQALYSVTEKVKHTVRTAPKASSTKKMDPSMQQLTKNIRDRLHSHELLKGYYVAVVNIDAVGVEGLATLHEFLNLKLSEAKAPNAPKEFGKDSQFPYFRMLDKGNRMEVAFTNDIRLRIQANQKKMDLYRLSCENKVCTTDNKQVAGNKNNEATVHIIR